MRFAGTEAPRRTVRRRGADIQAGDVIDYTRAGWYVVRFGPLDSPLEPITGPGRIAYNSAGDGIAVYDRWPMRLRLA